MQGNYRDYSKPLSNDEPHTIRLTSRRIIMTILCNVLSAYLYLQQLVIALSRHQKRTSRRDKRYILSSSLERHIRCRSQRADALPHLQRVLRQPWCRYYRPLLLIIGNIIRVLKRDSDGAMLGVYYTPRRCVTHMGGVIIIPSYEPSSETDKEMDAWECAPWRGGRERRG